MAQLFPYRYWIPFLVLAALGLWLYPRWVVDDAFISYRYAQNWVELGQLTWNPDQAPVEGFTGYALVLLAAACLRLGIAPETGLPIIGMMSAWLTLPMMGLVLQRLGVRQGWALFLCVLYALSPAFYLHSGSGLETSLFTLGIVAWLLWLTQDFADGALQRQGATALLMCAGLVLIRPEGLVFAGLAGWQFCWAAWRGRKWSAFIWPLAFFVLAAVAFGWRYQHFGTWLPNTFWAKRYAGLLNPESVKEAIRFGAYYLFLPLAAGGLLCLMDPEAAQSRMLSAAPSLKHLRMRVLRLGGLATLVVLLSYFRANLYMNYGGRFFFPLLPIAWMLVGLALQAGWDNFQSFREVSTLRAKIACWTLVTLAALQVAVAAYKWRAEAGWLLRYRAIVTEELIPLGKALRERFPQGGKLICYMDAGAIPYYSRLRATDFGRLNDAFLAMEHPGETAITDYFFAQEADVVVMTSYSDQAIHYTDENQSIVDDPRFSAYDLVRIYRAEGVRDYFQFLFARKIVP
jgi:hypothetical protein